MTSYCRDRGGRSSRARRQAVRASTGVAADSAVSASFFNSPAWTSDPQLGQARRDAAISVPQSEQLASGTGGSGSFPELMRASNLDIHGPVHTPGLPEAESGDDDAENAFCRCHDGDGESKDQERE